MNKTILGGEEVAGHIAVGEGNVEIVTFLLKAGTEVNGLTANGSPLHTACAWRRLKITKLLLENGADPS